MLSELHRSSRRGPDFVVEEASGKPQVVVEAKARHGDFDEAVAQVRTWMGDIRAPFGLVVAPGRVALIGAGETRETALDLLATYGLKPTSSTDPHLFEDVVHNWLMDLILGVADRPVPEGLPDLVGSDLRRR